MKNLINKTDNFPRTAVMALDLDDQQISEINRLAKTAYLWIDSSEMTSKVTESVQGLPDLHEIELHGHQITDDSLRELASLKSLNEVRIVNTSCTEEGIQRLLESLPKCSPGPDPSQFHYGIRIRTVKNEPGSSVEKFYELTPEGTLVHHE
ncbi:MAG: hypothetical protein MK102_08460 [Fuerstiella sp.]|nr:hypothetical protein [Fuerstiella sp.]